jgi:hypothetical protein
MGAGRYPPVSSDLVWIAQFDHFLKIGKLQAFRTTATLQHALSAVYARGTQPQPGSVVRERARLRASAH